MSLLLLFAGASSGGVTPPPTPTVAPASGAADPRAFRKKRRYVLPDGTVVNATQHEINQIMLQFLDEQSVSKETVKEAKKVIRQVTKEEAKALEPAKFPAEVQASKTVLVPQLRFDVDTSGVLRALVEGLEARRKAREEEEWLILTLH